MCLVTGFQSVQVHGWYRVMNILGILMIECGAWMELVTDMIKGRLPRVKPSKNLNRFGQARARRANRERQGAGRAHETELPT
jgi:hypothetical protein